MFLPLCSKSSVHVNFNGFVVIFGFQVLWLSSLESEAPNSGELLFR